MHDTRHTVKEGRDGSVGRRGFLRTAATATAAATGTAVLTAPAAAGRNSDGDAIDGHTEADVERAIRRGRPRKAAQLLGESGVAHTTERVAMPTAGEGDEGAGRGDPVGGHDAVSSQSVYDGDDSSFWMYVWSRGGDVYRAYCSWELAFSGTATIDGPGPADGVGITVSDAEWEPVLGSWQFGPGTSLRKRESLGVIGAFDDPDPYCDAYSCYWPSEEQRSSWMQVDLRKKSDGRHNVYGTYAHTWQSGGFWGGAGFGLSPGPISVSPDLGVDYWRIRSDQRI